MPGEAPVIKTTLFFRSVAIIAPSLVERSKLYYARGAPRRGLAPPLAPPLAPRHAATASRIAAIAAGRGKLLRCASATRREGTGRENGTGTTSRLWYFGISASRGSTDTPSPEA